MLGFRVFGGVGVGQQMLCGCSAFWYVGQGVGGCDRIGFYDSGYWVVGVAPLVEILGVSWSGLGCCGWVGAGPASSWGLTGLLGSFR